MTEKENTIFTGKERNSADHCRISNSKSVNNPAEAGGEGEKESSSSSSKKQGKSCKGCLYYSSSYKSNSRNPLCLGLSRSLPQDQKSRSADGQEVQTELPVCVGLEVLVERKLSSAEEAPGHARKREEGHRVPEPRSHKPTHSTSDEFLTRFTRNANLVAMGVAKNLQKVGNRISEGIDDIFYRRPK
ncbi:uncharacterized protein LOC129895248 isoform X3 [Solanum dulcamara]|uniref:uncharacterized protein LOC129895248 isoform X3 n=1 Tax=Solanum dulcamara TaxID=45834 RepID=UPI002486A639|nr:uncharacterized protein LOC129895248 isoform X3 [Solanum dulcamara]